jgi:hypothetical protein
MLITDKIFANVLGLWHTTGLVPIQFFVAKILIKIVLNSVELVNKNTSF